MELGQLDLNLLRVFHAVGTERHVTRAAGRLGVTQSAVSNALARLRVAFGDELFLRRPGGVEPTALAAELALPIANALDQVEAALKLRLPFDPKTAEEAWTLGMSEYAESVLAPCLVRILRAEAPRCFLAIRHIDRTDMEPMLDGGGIGLAFGVLPEPPSRFNRVMLLPDRFLSFMDAGHPLAQAEAMSLAAFASYPHILVSANGSRRGALDEPLEALGHPRRIAVVVARASAAIRMVQGSDLVCTTSARLVRPLAEHVPVALREPPVELRHERIAMVWHRRHDQHPAHVWLRRRLQSLARELVE